VVRAKRPGYHAAESAPHLRWKSEWDGAILNVLKKRDIAAHRNEFPATTPQQVVVDLTDLSTTGTHIAFAFVQDLIVYYRFAFPIPRFEVLHVPGTGA
jgi:hypothetical protein